ncbi:MAG: hypothetical protein AAF488_02410 [Planctomycetota bacterium]
MLEASRSNSPESKNGRRSDEEADLDHLRQVQEILFGRERRQLETRLADLDEVFRAQVKDLRSSSRSQVSQLEASLREVIQSLQDRLDREVGDRTSEHTRLAEEVSGSIAGLEQRIGERFDRLGALIDRELEAMREHLDIRTTEMTLQFDATCERLESKKVDRQQLSELFGSISAALDGSTQTD